MTLTESIRAHLRSLNATEYRLAKETGIARTTIRRFLAGEQLTSDKLDILAAYLGLELRPADEPKPPKGKRK